jgi:hypothetical protein
VGADGPSGYYWEVVMKKMNLTIPCPVALRRGSMKWILVMWVALGVFWLPSSHAAEPVPGIAVVSIASNQLELAISNVDTGGTYYVEYIEDLTTNNWTEVGSSFEGISGSTNWMDSLGVATSAFYRVVRDPYHPKVGEVATFTNYFSHGIAGTAHIVNNRTIELRNFSYDGQGPAVYVNVDSLPPTNGYSWGTSISDEIGDQPAYMNTNLTYTLPDGLDLDDVNYISVWCEQFSVDFGSGMFQ